MKSVVAKGRTIEEAIEKALNEIGASRDHVKTKVLEVPSTGFIGLFGNKYAKVEVTLDIDYERIAEDFLTSILDLMNIKFNVRTYLEDTTLKVSIEGPDMGILIGRRGQTLDSLQYLTSIVVNKNSEEYIRVLVDTEDYRNRREQTLKDLANKLAYRVEKSRRKIVLEPMNPYERRIIHSTLQNHSSVYTYSEGEEPYRKVVIDYKRPAS